MHRIIVIIHKKESRDWRVIVQVEIVASVTNKVHHCNFWDEEDMVTLEENLIFQFPFSEEEIKEAVFGSYADGAPGPDGFSFMYY